MIFPVVTAVYGSVFALLFAGLTAWVIAGRVTFRVKHGDGGQDRLNRRIRAHGNFAEYVPLILLIVALLEGAGAGRATVQTLLAVLLVARMAHPIGMLAPVASRQQFAFRRVSVIATWLVLVVAALLLLAKLV